jgi:hypothetical protein
VSTRSERVWLWWSALTLAGLLAAGVASPALPSGGDAAIAAGWYIAGLFVAQRGGKANFDGRWIVALLVGTTFPAWMFAWMLAAAEWPAVFIGVPSALMGLLLAWVTRWRGMVLVGLSAGACAWSVGHAKLGASWGGGEVGGGGAAVLDGIARVLVPHVAWNVVVSAGLAWWAWRRSVGVAAGERGA